MAMVGLFLAMLELMKVDLIKAEQKESFGSIYIRANTEEPAEQAVQNSIVANMEEWDAEEDEQPLPQPPPIAIKEIPAKPQPQPQPEAAQVDALENES